MQTSIFQDKAIAYTTEGEGFPLVLVHGFGEDQTIWENLLEPLAGFQLIRMDLPGVGQSALSDEATVENYAAAIKKILDDLSIEQCIMVGHSMGGYITLAFAELFSEYLKGYGLFHAHPFADTAETKEKRQKSIDFVKMNGPIHYVKQLIPKLFPPAYRTSNRFIIDQQIFKASKFSGEGIIACLELMMARPDRTKVMESSTVPVLCLIGEKDELIPAEKNRKQTHLAPTTAIHILPGIGHMGMLEAPKKTAKILRDFCDFCLGN